MTTSYSCILFDLDGTLVDSSLGIVNSFQHALAQVGIFEPEERLLTLIGPPIAEMLRTLHPERFADPKLLKRTIDYQRAYYKAQGVHENTLYPSVEDLLYTLKKHQKKLFIATSKPTVFAKKILENQKLDHYFEAIIGSNLNLTRTKKSEIIAHIQKKYLMDAPAIMIGDRHHDILAARQLGIDTVGVTYGYGSEKEIKEAKPTYIAKNLKDLEAILL